jgi:hypothetical protein
MISFTQVDFFAGFLILCNLIVCQASIGYKNGVSEIVEFIKSKSMKIKRFRNIKGLLKN